MYSRTVSSVQPPGDRVTLRYFRIKYSSLSRFKAGLGALLGTKGMRNFCSSLSDRRLMIGALEVSFITNSWPLLVLGDTSEEDLDT